MTLKQLRIDRGKTIEEVCKGADIKERTLYRFEEFGIPSKHIRAAQKLSKYFKIPFDNLPLD